MLQRKNMIIAHINFHLEGNVCARVQLMITVLWICVHRKALNVSTWKWRKEFTFKNASNQPFHVKLMRLTHDVAWAHVSLNDSMRLSRATSFLARAFIHDINTHFLGAKKNKKKIKL